MINKHSLRGRGRRRGDNNNSLFFSTFCLCFETIGETDHWFQHISPKPVLIFGIRSLLKSRNTVLEQSTEFFAASNWYGMVETDNPEVILN